MLTVQQATSGAITGGKLTFPSDKATKASKVKFSEEEKAFAEARFNKLAPWAEKAGLTLQLPVSGSTKGSVVSTVCRAALWGCYDAEPPEWITAHGSESPERR